MPRKDASGNGTTTPADGGRGSRKHSLMRALLVLGVLAVAAIAAVVVLDRTTSPITGFEAVEPQPLLPELRERPERIAEIEMRGQGTRFVLRRNDGSWTMATKANYPAIAQQADSLIERVSNVTAVYASTGDALSYADRGLGRPGEPDASLVTITFRDSGGAMLAGLNVGHSMTVPGGENLTKYFVRKRDDGQIWLADGDLTFDTTEGAWLENDIVDLSRERIVRMTVAPPEGARLTIRRAADGTVDVVEGPADGQTLKPESALDNPLGALEQLHFADVRNAEDFDTADAEPWRAQLVREDGLVYVARLYPQSDGVWAVLGATVTDTPREPGTLDAPTAEANASHPAAAAAQQFNETHGQWVYRLPPVAATSLMTRVSDLVQ